jgi:hypothetical protein
MITGDHAPAVVPGLSALQMAVEAGCTASQLKPHIGTVEPSGRVAVAGPAVKLTGC